MQHLHYPAATLPLMRQHVDLNRVSPPVNISLKEFHPRPPFAPAMCKFVLKHELCTLANCQFYHPPGLQATPQSVAQQESRLRPGYGYTCHNCGDESASHFKSDCPQPQQCRYTQFDGVCTRRVCPFFHPAGCHLPNYSRDEDGQPRPIPSINSIASVATKILPNFPPRQQSSNKHNAGNDKKVAYVCHNCGDATQSHFKQDCPYPQRCRSMSRNGVCNRAHCPFNHPTWYGR